MLSGMKDNHHERVRREFSKQAHRYGEKGFALTSPEHLQWMVDNLDLQPHFVILDVATGTGILGRAIAPYVKHVVAVDATAEMIGEGRRQAEHDAIGNIVFEQGFAENLPYPNGTFDMVLSRFAIHHFEDPHAPIAEMVRVCRPDGRVVVIDLVSPEDEALAATYNRLERMRDPSHAKALSASELKKLMKDAELDIVHMVSREVDVQVDRWLELTETTPEGRRTIVEELTQDLEGVKTTGMRPSLREDVLMFQQTWLILLGVKQGVK